MGNKQNIIGLKYNRLTILSEVPKDSRPNKRVIVRCDCGKQKEVILSSVIHGYSKSCGCLQKEAAAKAQTTHGLSQSKLGKLYFDILKRCNNPKSRNYPNYGGRGIAVCQEWEHDKNLFYSWAKSNGYAEGLQIDRIDTDGHYEPNNCHFIDRHPNKMNRRITVWLEYNGERKTMYEWAKLTGIKYKVLKDRKNKLKWSDSKVLSTAPKIFNKST